MTEKWARHLGLKAVVLLVLAASLGIAVSPVWCQGNSDWSDHWAQVDLRIASSKGLLRGYPDGSIKPNAPISRAELVAMLCRLLGEEENAGAAGRLLPIFSDLPSDHWALGYLRVCYEAGLVVGDGDGKCRPDDAITRAELATLVARTARVLAIPSMPIGAITYADYDQLPDWSIDGVVYASSLGLFRGDENGDFRPRDGSTRAEVVTAVLRMLELHGRKWDMVGSVVSVNLQSGRIAVSVSGSEITMLVSADTTLFRGRETISLDSLRTGERVSMVVDRQRDNVLAVVQASD